LSTRNIVKGSIRENKPTRTMKKNMWKNYIKLFLVTV